MIDGDQNRAGPRSVSIGGFSPAGPSTFLDAQSVTRGALPWMPHRMRVEVASDAWSDYVTTGGQTWTTMRTLVRRAARRAKPKAAIVHDVDMSSIPEPHRLSSDVMDDLRAAVRHMDARFRRALWRVIHGGESWPEAARAIGIAPSTVYEMLREAAPIIRRAITGGA